MSIQLRPELPPLPDRIKQLRLDPDRGYPVPWFVLWIDGKPDFRIADSAKRVLAVMRNICWVCGDKMGRHKAFVIGPMCAINRITSEPGCHRECAVWSAQACPFLTRPHARRREEGMPEDTTVDGHMIKRNPGVSLIWITPRFQILRLPDGGFLLNLDDPTEALWFAEGRAATRAEVEASVDSGFPELRKMAEEQSPAAVAELERRRLDAMRFYPQPLVVAP